MQDSAISDVYAARHILESSIFLKEIAFSLFFVAGISLEDMKEDC
jgi:hypothetical protein